MRRTKLDGELEKIVSILREYGADKIILFGSYLRGRRPADIDIALHGVRPKDFFRACGKVIKAVNKQVDLVDLETADSYFAKRILEEGKLLYEART